MEELSQSSSRYIKGFLGEDRWKKLQESNEQEARQILIGKKKEGVMIKDALTEFCTESQKDHRECEYMVDDIVVAHGNVVDEVISEAQNKVCDLIVMGYYVRGKLEEAMLGSTTRRVLRRSKVPVMLVRIN